MAEGSLSALDIYRFDASGWCVLPGVLTASQLASLATDDSDTALLAALAADLSVSAAVDTLVAGTVHDASEPGARPLHELLEASAAMPDGGSEGFLQQWGDGLVRDHAKDYHTHHGQRVCMGVRAVWCLDWDSDFLLIPGSHTAAIPTPAAVLGPGSPLINGPDGDAGGVKRPPLQPGDVLLHAANMVWGRRGGGAGRLLAAEFTTVNDAQNLAEFGAEQPDDLPDWLNELPPTQQAALGWHPSGGNGGDTGAALLSDGSRSWVSPALSPASTESPALYGSSDLPATLREPERHIGSGLELNSPRTGMEDYDLERWRWDVSGHLILRGVMDEEWVAQAQAAVNYITGGPRGGEAPQYTEDQWQHKTRFFAGQPNPSYGDGGKLYDPAEWQDGPKGPPPPGGVLGLPHPFCDPFRRTPSDAQIHRE